MGRSPCRDSDGGMRKGAWTSEEDELLVDHIRKNGQGNWQNLPKLAGLNRRGNSCRLRWINHLRPDLKKGCFTDDEAKLVIHLHSMLGNKWSSIATKLPGRSANEIKNFWNTRACKKFVNMGIDSVTHRPGTDLSFPTGVPNLPAATNFAGGGDSGASASASKDMNAHKVQSDATMLQLLQGHSWVSASLGAMGALVGKLNMLLLSPPQGCSSKSVKDGMCLLKDDVEEINAYLDELSKVEDPPPMAKCWMNEACNQSC